MNPVAVQRRRTEILVEIHGHEDAAQALAAIDFVSKMHGGIVAAGIVTFALDPDPDRGAPSLDPGRIVIG